MSGSNRADPRELGLPIAHGSTFSAMLSPGREEGAKRLPQELVNCLWSDSTSASLRKLHVSEGRTHQPNVTHHPNGFALRRKKISLCSGAVRRRSGPMRPGRFPFPWSHCSGSAIALSHCSAAREQCDVSPRTARGSHGGSAKTGAGSAIFAKMVAVRKIHENLERDSRKKSQRVEAAQGRTRLQLPPCVLCVLYHHQVAALHAPVCAWSCGLSLWCRETSSGLSPWCRESSMTRCF